MKVLQLTVKPPFPAVDGGCIAIKNFGDMILGGGHKLKILTLATDKHPFLEEEFPEDFRKATKPEGIYVNTEINLVDAFSSMVTLDSYNVSRFFSTDFDARLEELLLSKRFDVVLLESLFMTPYISTIRRNSGAQVILRSHNFEHSIWEQIAAKEDGKIKRWYLKYLASQLKKYELDVMDQLDGVISISSTDEKRYINLKHQIPIICIPFGIDLDAYQLTKRSTEIAPRTFHIGAMDWQPNTEGIHWFLKEVWPDFYQKNANASLSLAGRSMKIDDFDQSIEGVSLVGEVEDALQFIQNHDIMIVPLHTGGGIRIKILEGMAMGKAVIATPKGAEGIHAIDGEHILIAKGKEEFIEKLNFLHNNPKKIEEIGKNARNFALDNFNQSTLQERFTAFAESLIGDQETKFI